MRNRFDSLLTRINRVLRQHYGDRLVSAVVYGSVGRGTPGFDSDIDLLVVAEPLPRGRMARVREFDSVESTLEPRIWSLEKLGIFTSLSPMPRSQLPPRRSRKVTFRSQPFGPSGSTLPSTSI